MSNLVLITSVINTPNLPLSYSKVRSVFTRGQRFTQTKQTIESIKEKIPDHKMMIVECTDFTKEEKDYFDKECDYVLNLWDRKEVHKKIFGPSKSLGEGTMTIEALEYIFEQKIEFENLYKICGRYWLNADFKYNAYNNSSDIFKKIDNNINNIFTSFYKVTNKTAKKLLLFLKKNEEKMIQYIGYEVLFGYFLRLLRYSNIQFVDYIGYEGQVTVCGSKYIG